MTTEKRITHTDLLTWLDRLRERGTVYVPAKDGTGDVALTEVSRAGSVVLEYGNFRASPKAFFFPQNQTLLHLRNGQAEEPRRADQRMTFLFGVRPCDARALLALDDVFLSDEARDPYYADLREKTVVISLACTRSMSSCFCTSVGGGPGDEAGADVSALPLKADLLLRAQTPKGEKLLSDASDLLADAGPDSVERTEELLREVEDQIASLSVDRSTQQLPRAWDSALWDAVGRKCLGCGTCSFLCPTCHCFDITDEVRGGGGRRVRTWDCCAYPLFTLHGSGHNPRPTPRERWRQRIMHKFRYAVENFDIPFCVGCGRCVRSCPAGLDLRTALKELGA